jgi:hypothetical protein
MRLATVEVYNPYLDAWAWAAPMPTPRESHAAAVYEGAVIVSGGHDGQQYLSSVDIYLPAHNLWVRGPAMTAPRAQHAMHVIRHAHGAALVVVGGSDGQRALRSVEVLPLPSAEELDRAVAQAQAEARADAQAGGEDAGVSVGVSAGLSAVTSHNLSLVAVPVDFSADPRARALCEALLHNAWRSLASMTSPRTGSCSVVLPPRADLPEGAVTWAAILETKKALAKQRRRELRDEM